MKSLEEIASARLNIFVIFSVLNHLEGIFWGFWHPAGHFCVTKPNPKLVELVLNIGLEDLCPSAPVGVLRLVCREEWHRFHDDLIGKTLAMMSIKLVLRTLGDFLVVLYVFLIVFFG